MNAQPQIIDLDPEDSTAATPKPAAAIVTIPHGGDAPRDVTPLAMLDRALASGADVTMIEKLMDLQDRHEKKQARQAFDAALAEAKAKIKVVGRNREGHNSKRYADFSAYAKVIDPILGEHGLSYRFRSRQDERIHVTCILSHRNGHSEENTLSGPADTTGSKNAIQAIGSTLTYLQRYTLTQALGLAAGDDDDGKAAGNVSGVVSEAQADQVKALIVEAAVDLPKFLQNFGIDLIEDLPILRFSEALAVLNMKIAADKKKAAPKKESAA